jgi:CRISPR/Cas system type I-B associated protein Csh2 (Cas7 group RAMP superfamily)
MYCFHQIGVVGVWMANPGGDSSDRNGDRHDTDRGQLISHVRITHTQFDSIIIESNTPGISLLFAWMFN